MSVVYPQLRRTPTPVLLWRLDRPLLAIASAPLGGGIGTRAWVLNATVPASYDRDDPEVHLGEIAAGLDLAGPGVGLLTALDVSQYRTAEDGGVRVCATVGLGAPAWPAAPDGDGGARWPGTVNVVALVPAPLSAAALVNAVATVAEAKAQALWELGVPGTGTATDATCVLCGADPAATGLPEPYGGPRSRWGARLARAVHAAVRDGATGWLNHSDRGPAYRRLT
ncbi:MAG: adenosylcobinamide amidohydrolase [Micromonosporaceae bacterium]|nr:adenosylcobinamide amidohydrolase [Micromonosporaceae bacterium]